MYPAWLVYSLKKLYMYISLTGTDLLTLPLKFVYQKKSLRGWRISSISLHEFNPFIWSCRENAVRSSSCRFEGTVKIMDNTLHSIFKPLTFQHVNCGWVHPVPHVSWIKYNKTPIPHSQLNFTCIYCTRSFTTCLGFNKPSSSVSYIYIYIYIGH
jgi:hypothetical protein